MIHLGDITKINGAEVPVVDCVVGGSPCQDLSVAGLRKGLEGERSGLYMEQIRIIKEMRENDRRRGRPDVDIRPRYMVWENVPGAFSSNKGEDFRIVLEEAAKVADENATIPRPENGKWTNSGCIVADGWSISWRVLDAQFWGVPQRRRRIALVADFGGQSASEILLVRKILSGDTESSRTERKATTINAQGSSIADDRERPSLSFQERAGKPGGGKGILIQDDRIGCLSTLQNQYVLQVDMGGGKSSVDINEDRSPTLTTTHYGEPAVVYDARGNGDGKTCCTITGGHQSSISDFTGIVVSMDRETFNSGKSFARTPGIYEDGIQPTLVSRGPGAIAYAETIAIEGNGQRQSHKGDGYAETDKSYTLNATEMNGVAYACNWDGSQTSPTLTANNAGGSQRMPDKDNFNCVVQACDLTNLTESDVNGALQAMVSNNIHSNNVVRVKYIVRRLTPLECERLQGYPDGWTDIGEYTDTKGKKCKSSDAARYKALGNSIALPQWKWVLKRICSCYERDATMASLFDGIGGFPYLWEQINGKGTALWASEIEEFPIAVTKERIGD